MAPDALTLVDAGIGMLAGAFLVARRDPCGRIVRQVCGIPARWSAVVAGAVTGSGLSMLAAATSAIHAVVLRWN